jgi:hypothetical protein
MSEEVEVKIPEQFWKSVIYLQQVELAKERDAHEKRTRIGEYLDAIGDWQMNYFGNGVCDPLPVVPVSGTRVVDPITLEIPDPAESTLRPVVDEQWVPDGAMREKMLADCLEKLGLDRIPRPEQPIEVHIIWYNAQTGIANIGARDTAPAGFVTEYEGDVIVKVRTETPFGFHSYYRRIEG